MIKVGSKITKSVKNKKILSKKECVENIFCEIYGKGRCDGKGDCPDYHSEK